MCAGIIERLIKKHDCRATPEDHILATTRTQLRSERASMPNGHRGTRYISLQIARCEEAIVARVRAMAKEAWRAAVLSEVAAHRRNAVAYLARQSYSGGQDDTNCELQAIEDATSNLIQKERGVRQRLGALPKSLLPTPPPL